MNRNLQTLGLCLCLACAGTTTALAVPGSAAFPSSAVQQTAPCQGVVKDASGAPVVGASVVVEGTLHGTTTGIDGNFQIPNVTVGATIRVSFIGYQTVEIPWNGSTLDVTLNTDTQNLEEVVVVGYGSQKKVNVIGSISTIDSEILETRATPNVINMLTGMMPGVTISQTSGNPGQDGGTIRVRGVGSFGATPSPLVLVDGLPGDLNDINPTDIDNISVLKDASSAAIYGSRAANGVILVTTKRGGDVARITYNGSVGISQATELPRMAHSYEYAEFYNMAMGTETYTREQIQKYRDGSDPDNYADEMYLEQLLGGHAMQTKHEVSASGGSDRFHYMASLAYLRQDGLLENNYFNRYNARINLNAKLAKNLDLSVRVSGMASDRHEPSTPGILDQAGYKGIISQGVRYPGLVPTRLQNGEYGLGPKLQGTPVAWQESASFYREDNDKFRGNAELAWKPVKGLTLRAIGGYNFTLNHIRHYRTDMTLTGGRSTGPSSLSDGMTRTVYKTFQALADYSATFGTKHNFSALVGYTWEDEGQRNVSGYRLNYPSDDVPYLDAGGADGQTNGGGGYDWAIQSVFGRLTYNYDQRYLFEATMRYDGSSRFPNDSKYGLFPSVALGWRVSEESFWKESASLRWFNNLKVKASYGVLGNNNIGNYPYQSVYALGQAQNYVFGGVYTQGAAITTYVDPTLKWERTRTMDFGVETSFFNNKLSFNASYFYRKTSDILYTPSASYSSIFGLGVSQVNTGEVENKGWEFELIHQNRIGKFSYHVNANFSIINNKVLTLGMGNVQQNNGMIGNGSNLFIGYPMNMYYGYKTDGVFLSDDEVADWYDQSSIAPGSVAGDIRYVDTTGDGKVNADDRVYLGSSIPKYTFGINLGAEYAGFDFNMLIQGVAHVNGYLSGYSGWAFFGEGNIQKWQMDECWNVQQNNRYPGYPRLEVMSNAGTNNTLTSDFWLLNASYVKVRNIQLGYTLPQSVIRKIGASRLRIYISADNPFGFNNFREGWDPENGNDNGNYYPIMSTYTLGLTLNF